MTSWYQLLLPSMMEAPTVFHLDLQEAPPPGCLPVGVSVLMPSFGPGTGVYLKS